MSVGCDNGADPSVRSHRVLSTDRIGTPVENAIPFHYVQVAGAPVSGRSGGGLFAPEGYLIGVCNTADPVENDGHFVPPKVIQMVLDKLQLSSVYQNPSLGDAEIVGIPESAGVPNHAGVPAKWGGSPIDAAMAKPLNLNDKERATLEEIQRRAQDGDEVILIVRSRRNPEIPSNVIILNGTSDQFLEALTQHQSVIRDDSVHESIEAPPRPLRPIASGPQTVSFPVFH